jgi:hypothetical protein
MDLHAVRLATDCLSSERTDKHDPTDTLRYILILSRYHHIRVLCADDTDKDEAVSIRAGSL